MIEREAADRVDRSRHAPLRVPAQGGAREEGLIADKDGLAAEAELGRCRNYIPPVRRTCVTAARALVSLIEEQAAGAATTATKQIYADAMPQCERWMGLAPLQTSFRSTG